MNCDKCQVEMPDMEGICVKHKVKTLCCHQCCVRSILSYYTSEKWLLPVAQNPALSLCVWLPGRGRWKNAQKCNLKQTYVKTASGLLSSVKTMAWVCAVMELSGAL